VSMHEKNACVGPRLLHAQAQVGRLAAAGANRRRTGPACWRRLGRSGRRLLRCLAALCLPLLLGGCKSRPPAPILTWHEIAPDGAPAAEGEGGWRVPQSRFLAQLDALSAAGLQTIPLSQVAAAAEGGPRPGPRAIALTFDDGTQDQFERVLPALRAHRMTAAFFVVAGKLGKDEAHRVVERTPEGEKRYLIWPEVLALQAAGMEIGSHSLTHPRLPELSEAAALEELSRSRALLSEGLGRPCELLAWPYNSVRAATKRLAQQAGYRAAVAGVVHGSADRFALYRIPVMANTAPVQLAESLLR
jgi:peptidoglycan/xylan/chitin deacetylase (PgdA/CDA1 family)